MNTIHGVNQTHRPQQNTGNGPAVQAKKTKSERLETKDSLDIGNGRAAIDAEKQIEAEYAARKAEIMRQEKEGSYNPDAAMDYIAKHLAKGMVEHR
jgi:hypothetical protein